MFILLSRLKHRIDLNHFELNVLLIHIPDVIDKYTVVSTQMQLKTKEECAFVV